MKLQTPIIITARLMAGVKVGEGATAGYLSLEPGPFTAEGRVQYHAWIDLPDGSEHEITDLRSGVGGGSIQEGLGALLSFLGAAAESYQYRERTGRKGENEELFAPAVVEWAAANSDEIGMLAYDLEETPGLVSEG